MISVELSASIAKQVKTREQVTLRIFAIICILGSGIALWRLLWTVVDFFREDGIDTIAQAQTPVSIVVIGISTFCSAVLLALFIIASVRLFVGEKKKAALVINIMILFAFVELLCQLTIWGVSLRLIPFMAALVVLIVLQTFFDPSLTEERILQRKLYDMELRSENEEGMLGRDESGKGYIKLNFYNIFWIFVLCSIVGVVIETIYHFVEVVPGELQDRAGMLYGPFSPIYGFGGVLMTMALNRFHKSNPLVIFLISALIGGVFEYFVSWFLELAFGLRAWDYSGTFLSIDGRTNGMYMAFWGLLGLAWIKLALPHVLSLINLIPLRSRTVITILCAILMFSNGFLTIAAFDCWYQRDAGAINYEDASALTQFCNEYYNDDFMKNRFQSMSIDPSLSGRVE